MKCPSCPEVEMEKARKGDKYFCRECGHSETTVTKEELITQVAELREEVKKLTEKKKEKETVEDPW